ncbi:DUF221-domain-containing protein [Metschnikowia bicuspidata var. bicuspidata NRRL YB-4993]|uniref:DUF221-domain-containing protein n=1 Tax=Metschnikowia bicuspidata var. bicuspidata NRRL YB-4993 TaxID=869754 RepID=A0A1A0HIS2_9ASCO|nr:DUF221-domain-containing protein [Metschnikowia bicuspidata var. bicuspidata NRRL YB-4993]OBA23910.1 DUF221-domain-containing protein [Metschnikowia bicuspidata var. bicuspidata NRRL YB-4993]
MNNIIQALKILESSFQNSYSSIVYSFLKFFVDPEVFVRFLNNDQTGSAHMSYGTDVSVLLKHLMTSLCICLIEIFLFCYLRAICVYIYQPRCFCTPEGERMELLPQGFFDWIKPSWKYDINCFLSMGLDTYFFLRFINILLIFFASCGLLNLIVLLPINLTGSTFTFRAKGLDRLSISNIAMSKVDRLNFHFVCSLITIGFFNFLILHEFRSIAKIRYTYLNSFAHRNRASSRVLLLGNVPGSLLDSDSLHKSFNLFCEGLEHIWILDDYYDFWWQWKKAVEALDILEMKQMRILKTLGQFSGELNHKFDMFYPPIYLPLISIPIFSRVISLRLPGFLRAIALQKPKSIDDWCLHNLEKTLEILQKRVDDIAAGNYVKQSKVFLMFKSQESAYMAHQVLLTLNFGFLDESIVEVNHNDIIWRNLARKNNWVILIEKYFFVSLLTVIICIYVVPVSLIALFSQIPLITQLIPFMGFLNRLPEEIKTIFSSFLPTILLSMVTTMQLKVFRVVLSLKGNWTGAELELDIQCWYFAFLFIQQFLVVSVLTSLIVVLLQVVEKPVSIPILLAANIPKSSVFFFKYLSVKTFSYCGSNFLRLSDLLAHFFIYPLIDRTPRMKFNRLTSLRKVKWGSLYSTLSVYGAIGITYSTISPVVSVFMILILLLTFLYYKHALHYMYSHVNDSETNGKMYPRALFHLYSGIYCLECCMIGIFVSLENQKGDCPMKFQALMMACVLLVTIFGNIVFYRQFQKLFSYFPQMSDETAEIEEERNGSLCEHSRGALLYFHPCYNYEKPTLWLPENSSGVASKIIGHYISQKAALAGGSTDGAILIEEGMFMSFKLLHEPPRKKVTR